MSAEIRFYRHGETEWNKCGRLQGWLDSSLTEAGRNAARLVQWAPDLVFCSDLPRARETAKLMFPDCELRQSAALREIYLGDWQGRSIKDLQQDAQYSCYMQSPGKFEATTQESFDEVTARMLQFYREIQELPQRKIAVVSHGVAIACLATVLQRKPRAQLWDSMLAGCEWISFSN
ncbi:MAG: histidine phosphatase family protein [Solibacillus sp.]